MASLKFEHTVVLVLFEVVYSKDHSSRFAYDFAVVPLVQNLRFKNKCNRPLLIIDDVN